MSGSSVSLVTAEMERFLTEETADALAVVGDWGSGKTFTWNAAVDRIRGDASKKLARPGYAYVSLFGINSIAQLNVAIFQQSDVTHEGTNQKEKDALGKLLRFASKFRSAPLLKDYAEAAEQLMAYEIRDRIVCFDDLERMSPGLSVKELMGFASFLKERRNCKIAFIAHVNRLEERAEFEKLSEKVVDITLRFSRAADDAAKIAIADATPLAQQTREKCEALGITNIRVIRQIWRLVRTIDPMLSGYDSSVMDQAVHSLPLFGWCRLQQNDSAPSEEFVLKKRGDIEWRFANKNVELTADEKRWSAVLDRYGFAHVDEFDTVLVRGVADGFFHPDDLKNTAEQKHALAVSEKAGSSVRDAWAKFHHSLEIPGDEVADAIFESVKMHAKFVTPMNLNGAVRILKELDHPKKASELIDHYVAANADNEGMFDLSEYTFAEDVNDTDVRAAFDARFQAIPDERDPLDVLIWVSKNGTRREDRRLLSKLSPNDFVAIFKRAGENTRRVIDACLDMGPMHPGEPAVVIERARAALVIIGRESAVNRLRVKRYGITDEDLDTKDGDVKD